MHPSLESISSSALFEHKYHKYKSKYMGLSNSSSNYSLSIRDPWLFYIQKGIKTVEGRRGGPTKYNDWLNKTVSFYNDKRKIPVKVIAVRHYLTLDDFLDAEGWEKVMPGIESRKEVKRLYNEFYTDESIKEAGGMVAIQVELV